MAKLKFSGPLSYRLRSFLKLNQIAVATYFRHRLGRRMAPDWAAHIEIGIRFWRHQFTTAMRMGDMQKGRVLFDSLVTQTDDMYEVQMEHKLNPKGCWYTPNTKRTDAVLLYFHGGGYSFSGTISDRFAAMLCHHTGAALFAPDYRLTPEHPHPAQAQDAMAAWRYLTRDHLPQNIVLIGDSAGGHMALMHLLALKAHHMPQPGLCVGLCPWTDIGSRGDSLEINNQYDLVQGWMALQFGQWLDPDDRYGRKALSPINHDFSGLAPIYMQTGGREILNDMIVQFADIQQKNGADIQLDSWADMPHNFQAYDQHKKSSAAALEKLARIVQSHPASKT